MEYFIPRLEFLEQNPNYEYALHFCEWDSKYKTRSGAAQKCSIQWKCKPLTPTENAMFLSYVLCLCSEDCNRKKQLTASLYKHPSLPHSVELLGEWNTWQDAAVLISWLWDGHHIVFQFCDCFPVHFHITVHNSRDSTALAGSWMLLWHSQCGIVVILLKMLETSRFYLHSQR